MTKFNGAHSEPLFTLLRTGMYTLRGEKSELADRATLRQGGTVPRHTVGAVKSVTERVFFCSCAIGLRGYVKAGHVEYGFCYAVNHSFTMCHPLTL